MVEVVGIKKWLHHVQLIIIVLYKFTLKLVAETTLKQVAFKLRNQKQRNQFQRLHTMSDNATGQDIRFMDDERYIPKKLQGILVLHSLQISYEKQSLQTIVRDRSTSHSV